MSESSSIQPVVEEFGPRCTIVGLALWASDWIYVLVLFAVYATQTSAKAGGGEPLPAVLPLALAFVGLFGSLPAAFVLRTALLKPVRDMETPDPREAAAAYFRAALVSSALAEAPGLFGVVLGLLQLTAGTDSTAWFLWVGLGLLAISLAAKTFLVPTAGRLEAFLRDLTGETGRFGDAA